MRLTIVGCSGSFPGPQSPASSYLVQAEHAGRTWSILLDFGNGSLGVLQRFVDPGTIDAVFLSHLHPDHCLDLCGLYVMQKYRPGGAAEHRIPVWGPGGVDSRLAMAYAGIEEGSGMSTVFDFWLLGHQFPVEIGPFQVMPYRVNHPVESFGLRVEAGGSVLAYTGDTDTCGTLSPLMTGANVVLADSAFMEGRDDASRGVHLTGRRAAQAAIDAGGVEQLFLTHIPVWNDPQVCRAEAAEVWGDSVSLVTPEQSYEF